jgi:hypothetical protein
VGLVGFTEDGAAVLDAPRMSVEAETIFVELCGDVGIRGYGNEEGRKEVAGNR